MRAASSGLRHPASASCLGRHSHLAGRCPNNSSLFPPLAAVVVVAAERLFLFVVSKLLFHGRSRGGKRQLPRRFPRKRSAAGDYPLSLLTAFAASSPEGGAFGHLPVSRAKPPPFGGGGTAQAVTERVRAPLGELAKPQALTEGGKPQKKKPLHKNCAMVSLVTVSNSQSRIRRAPELPSQLRHRGERRS